MSFFYDNLKTPQSRPRRHISDQDYKSLCAAGMICTTLVNIQTHTDSIWPAYLESSASWANKYPEQKYSGTSWETQKI